MPEPPIPPVAVGHEREPIRQGACGDTGFQPPDHLVGRNHARACTTASVSSWCGRCPASATRRYVSRESWIATLRIDESSARLKPLMSSSGTYRRRSHSTITGQTAISAFIASLTDHSLAHTELHRIVYRSADAVALELCRAVNEQVVTRLAEAIGRGVRAGTLHATNPQLTARLLYHGAHDALHDAVSGSLPRPGRDDLVVSFQEVAERALTTPAPPASWQADAR